MTKRPLPPTPTPMPGVSFGPPDHRTAEPAPGAIPLTLRIPLRCILFAVLIAFTSLLPGCILERLWATHGQFYQVDPQILVQRQEGAATKVVFLKPTLLEKDVEWLIGCKPTQIESGTEATTVRYALGRPGLRKPYKWPPMELVIKYRKSNDDLLVSEVVFPKAIEPLLSPELLNAAVAAVRVPQADLFRKQVTFDLSALEPVPLPGRAKVEALLGPPDQVSADSSVLTYQLSVLQPDRTLANSERSISLRIHLDAAQRVKGVQAEYFRYKIRADMDTAAAYVGLR